ncbi:MAG TPA: regulatory protein RecX [Paludibacter sp.]|jgi:regulatory protein|nr:MAG: Regulatory protein RecX [Bacteroidetes bacterium ADurb.Bin174]HQB27892.1 regulatory protein RecX [Paludibacter sp.]
MDQHTQTYETTLHKAAAYCSSAERCISELKEKLNKWEVDESDQHKIIDYLIQEKFIDEKRFATAYAKDKFKYNKWGKIKISYQLNLKQINKNIIEQALTTIDEDEYNALVFRLAKDKLKKITFKSEYEKKGKLAQFLSGKGFENELIYKVLEELESCNN